MILRSITITRLPGIQDRVHIEGFSPGVNFITGPNASGKTSLIRALHYLLKPKQKEDPSDLILEAEFELNGEVWSVTRTAQDPIWRHQGQIVASPKLPLSDVLDCHLIRLEDLLVMGQNNEAKLAEALAIEMDGGLNLRALRKQSQEGTKITARSERSAAQKSQAALNVIRNEHRALAHRQRQLPELKQLIEHARQAQSEVQILKLALEASDLRKGLKSLEAQKALLPEVLARLSGDELRQLQDLEDNQSRWERKQRDLETELTQYRLNLEDTGFERSIPTGESIEMAKSQLEALDGLSRQRDDQQKQLAIAQRRVQDAMSRLDPDDRYSASNWPALSVENINDALSIARQLDRAHLDSQQALQAPRTTPKWIWIAILSNLLLILIGLNLSLSWVTLLAVIATGVLSIWQFLVSPNGSNTSSDVSGAVEALERKAQALAHSLGFHPALLGEHSGVVFSDAYRQLRAALEEQMRLVAELEHDEQVARNIFQQLDRALDDWDKQTSTDSFDADLAMARHNLRGWMVRAQRAHQLNEAMHQTEHQLELARQELSRIWASTEALYRKAGLNSGEKSGLVAMLDQQTRWHQLHSEIVKQRALLEDRLARLSDHHQWLDAVERESEQTLQEQLNQYQQLALQLESLQEQYTKLTTDIENTSKGERLATANAAHESALDRLAEKQATVLLSSAELFWLNYIDQQTRATSGDRMFDEARALFGAFTHYQWDLILDESFSALRTKDHTTLRLDQLSTATRMQLLLAVRMARVMKEERGHESLPIFIDEALTTSDPNRAATIIDTLNTMAADHARQIIYLAASDYELQLWQHLTNDEPTLIRLSQGMNTDPTQPVALAFDGGDEIPPPKNLSPEQYARALGIGRLKAFQPAEDIPLIYLLADELSLLYELMNQWRLKTLGAFERWLTESKTAHHLIAERQQEFLMRCSITRRWWGLWHQGRSQPLDEGILHQAVGPGGLTELTLQGVLEVAQQVEFDATALIDYLEAHPISMGGTKRKLRQPQQQQLTAFLENLGYLPEADILTAESLRTQSLELAETGLTPEALQSLQLLIDRLEAGAPETGNAY